jgi:hypothetical protein
MKSAENSVPFSQRIQYFSIVKGSLFILFREVTAVYFWNHLKHKTKVCEIQKFKVIPVGTHTTAIVYMYMCIYIYKVVQI